MAYWLTVTPCVECDENCTQCPLRDRPVELHAVESETKPERAVNGPRDSAEELLGVLAKWFTFGADGLLRMKDCASKGHLS